MKILSIVMASWKESLRVFRPSNFKSLLLVSLKSLSNFWSIAFFGLATLVFYFNNSFEFTYRENLVLVSIAVLLLTLFFASTRSSIENKTFYYYWRSRVVVPAILMLGFYFLASLVIGFSLDSFVIAGVLVPLLVFIILFLFDSQESLLEYVRSILRGCLMVVYNLPFLLVISVAYLLGIASVSIISMLFVRYGGSYVAFVLWPLLTAVYISILVSFYIKRVHDQYLIYFKEKNI